MADMSVHIFVQNLRELMKSQHPDIACEKDQLESLYNDVFLMSSFLKKIEEKCSFDDEKVNNLVTEIRQLVLEAETIVDHFVMEQWDEHNIQCVLCSMNIIHSVYNAARMWFNSASPSLDLNSLQKQIEKVKIEMDQMNANFDQSTTLDGDVGKKIQKKTVSRERSVNNSEAAVGMDETIEKILAGFDGDQEMEVISLVGLPGIGKTTLAEKIFEHSRTRSSFPVRAWATVSQTYSSKQLLIDILKSSSLYKDSDADSSENRLGEDMLKRLKDKKYLIVLDDIWSIEAWNGIQRSFPSNRNGSRVIYTSRFSAIGKELCRDINTHHVSCLSKEHSWDLLQNKVFGCGDQRRCPPELERFGREIAKKCDGLPLAIVVIGGILTKKKKTTELWEQVARCLAPTIATDREAYMDTLALSYQHLPVHLKACFLYIGSIFHGDYEIPMRNLVWLLVSEGFSIQENNDDQPIQSSEGIVEGYLNDLVERSLVTVGRKRSCGTTKTIRIHDLLRDFCLVRGEQEMFVLKADITFGTHSSAAQRKVKGKRRLLSNRLFLENKRYPYSSSNLRSFFLGDLYPNGSRFDDSRSRSGKEVFGHNFRLLKVLQVGESVEEAGLLNKIEEKAHLRYLAVTSRYVGINFAEPNTVFTSSVTKLLWLETLILSRASITNMPDGIWNMVKLRHLYNKEGVFHFKVSPSQGAKRISVLPNLQTLHSLCACKSCLTNLLRFPNLKKLGLEGRLISECRCCPSIPDLGFLEQLVTLKVSNLRFDYNRSSTLFKFRLPASLRKLTLDYTRLKWEEISVLAELENLEVLKLLDNACVCSGADYEWDTSDLDFPKLKYLKMKRLDIGRWKDSNLQFESLEVLELHCKNLESIPFDLALSPSLHTIEVTYGSLPSPGQAALVMLAKEIAAEHERQCGNSDLQVFIKSDPWL